MLCELLAVCHNHIGEVQILGAPQKVVLDNGDDLFDALRLVEPLILLDTGAVPLPERQQVGLYFFVVGIHFNIPHLMTLPDNVFRKFVCVEIRRNLLE